MAKRPNGQTAKWPNGPSATPTKRPAALHTPPGGLCGGCSGVIWGVLGFPGVCRPSGQTAKWPNGQTAKRQNGQTAHRPRQPKGQQPCTHPQGVYAEGVLG